MYINFYLNPINLNLKVLKATLINVASYNIVSQNAHLKKKAITKEFNT